MDYYSNIKRSYTINFDHPDFTELTAYVMLMNGDTHIVGYNGDTENYDEVVYNIVNFCNREFESSCVMFLYCDNSGEGYYLFTSYYVDYFIIESFNTNGYYQLCSLYHNEESESLHDLGVVMGYSKTPSYGTYSSEVYSDYQINYSAGNSFVVDLYNIKEYVDGSTTYPSAPNNLMAVRGENISYSKYVSAMSFNSYNELTISYGDPISGSYRNGYDNGFSNGLSDGYVRGFDDGFQNGINNGAVGVESANAFSYIGTAFNSVGNLLSIEVLPNVTLGLCFSIPLVFTLILTIFKLVRK